MMGNVGIFNVTGCFGGILLSVCFYLVKRWQMKKIEKDNENDWSERKKEKKTVVKHVKEEDNNDEEEFFSHAFLYKGYK